MELLEPWRRGGSHDVAAIAARLGFAWARGKRRVVGLRGLDVCARCRTCSTLDVRDGGGRCPAPPSRSEERLLTRRSSSPRKMFAITVKPSRV